MLGIKTFSCKIKVKMKQETKSQNHNETTVLDLRLRLLNRAITEYQRDLEPNSIIAQKTQGMSITPNSEYRTLLNMVDEMCGWIDTLSLLDYFLEISGIHFYPSIELKAKFISEHN